MPRVPFTDTSARGQWRDYRSQGASGMDYRRKFDPARIEETLKGAEWLYRAIGESTDFGMWVCDAQGRNLYASESFLRLVGMTQD